MLVAHSPSFRVVLGLFPSQLLRRKAGAKARCWDRDLVRTFSNHLVTSASPSQNDAHIYIGFCLMCTVFWYKFVFLLWQKREKWSDVKRLLKARVDLQKRRHSSWSLRKGQHQPLKDIALTGLEVAKQYTWDRCCEGDSLQHWGMPSSRFLV